VDWPRQLRSGADNAFVSQFCTKTVKLPRQTRDKHRNNWVKSAFSAGC
jgi:hypothetical protein